MKDKISAVEWLVEQLKTMDTKSFNRLIQIEMSRENFEECFEQAKAMEKEQIKMCCIRTMETCNSDMNKLGCKTMDDYFNYIYNETFKSK